MYLHFIQLTLSLREKRYCGQGCGSRMGSKRPRCSRGFTQDTTGGGKWMEPAQGRKVLGVLLDLFSRGVVGWTSHHGTEVSSVPAAAWMARRLPRPGVDLPEEVEVTRGPLSSLSSLGEVEMNPGMSRRVTYWGNAASESYEWGFGVGPADRLRSHGGTGNR